MSTRIRPAILPPKDAWRSRLPIDVRNNERRMAPRYAANAEVELVVADNPRQIGHGTLVNISSRGVLIATGHCASTHVRAKVVIPWPPHRNDAATMNLHIAGPIVRADGGLVAIRIVHAEFRSKAVAQSATSSANTR